MRSKCKVDGCECQVDSWKDTLGNEHLSEYCQKHRKLGPRQRRIFDDTPMKDEVEFRDGIPLCMVKGCKCLALKRKGGKRAKICDHHGRSYHQHKERLVKKRYGAKLRIYGISGEEYDKLFKEQDGLCAICHEEPANAIDHNHETGKVRALLCTRCNAGLGQFREDVTYMLNAIEYIKTHTSMS